jgi:hypothetical protein
MVNDGFPPSHRYGFELVDAQNAGLSRHNLASIRKFTADAGRFSHDFSAN